MRLFRSDLEKLIFNQLFEISADSLDLDEDQLVGGKLTCTLSVEHANNGYRVHGPLKATFLEKCDRCLFEYKKGHETLLDVILTDNDELINSNNIDIIRFAKSEEFIDLSPIVHDIILLTKPFKRICNESCMGLCPHCGINLNKSTCSCALTEKDSRWDTLKDLKN